MEVKASVSVSVSPLITPLSLLKSRFWYESYEGLRIRVRIRNRNRNYLLQSMISLPCESSDMESLMLIEPPSIFMEYLERRLLGNWGRSV